MGSGLISSVWNASLCVINQCVYIISLQGIYLWYWLWSVDCVSQRFGQGWKWNCRVHSGRREATAQGRWMVMCVSSSRPHQINFLFSGISGE